MIASAIACLFVYLVNASAAAAEKPRYADAAGISAMLCVSFGLTNTLVALHGLPEAVLFFPVMDAVFAFMVWSAWRRDRALWKILLAWLLVAQLAMHVVLIAVWNDGALNYGGIYSYVVMINVDFALQLLTVGSVGAAYWISRLVHRLSALRGGHSKAHARWS